MVNAIDNGRGVIVTVNAAQAAQYERSAGIGLSSIVLSPARRCTHPFADTPISSPSGVSLFDILVDR